MIRYPEKHPVLPSARERTGAEIPASSFVPAQAQIIFTETGEHKGGKEAAPISLWLQI